ncbi:hypothetical protein SLOPH_1654 [Spraguea lophii 42_110]|uniref:PIN domain-containing protein n=1 Tax=Spraguea lophii (strain 42_110) TaxID=1358809 RepID=S7W8A0_SPRLO|nr:hypothetical protein SLOPH_1654 [Spraguea lophii 42_110]
MDIDTIVNIIIDTNILIHDYSIIECLLSHKFNFHISICIPKIVLYELDKIKTVESRLAVAFIEKIINNINVEVEGYTNINKMDIEEDIVIDENITKLKMEINDDQILDKVFRKKNSVLLTRDKILNLKAKTFNLRTYLLKGANELFIEYLCMTFDKNYKPRKEIINKNDNLNNKNIKNKDNNLNNKNNRNNKNKDDNLNNKKKNKKKKEIIIKSEGNKKSENRKENETLTISKILPVIESVLKKKNKKKNKINNINELLNVISKNFVNLLEYLPQHSQKIIQKMKNKKNIQDSDLNMLLNLFRIYDIKF